MISYAPLFETMKKKGITSYQLGKSGFPMSNYHAMKRGKNVTTHMIDTLCGILDRGVSDIMEYVQKADNQSDN